MGFDSNAVGELLRQGKYAEVITECDDFLSRADTAVPERVDALQKKASALRRSGLAWHWSAADLLREALTLLGDSEPALQAQVLVDLLAVYSNVPDPAPFKAVLMEYLALCENHQEARAWMFFAYYNAGVNATYSREFDQAREAFEQAMHHTKEPHQAGICQQNLAFVNIQLNRLAEAQGQLTNAKAVLPFAQYGPVLLDTEARLLLATGDVVAAQQLIEAGLAHPALGGTMEVDLRLGQALLAKTQGDFEAARRLALMAMDAAYKAGYWAGTNAAGRLFEEVRAI